MRLANILIIDDDEQIRKLVALYLEDAGHVVRHAENGRTGLEMVEQGVPDLILLDINMPVMDGTQVMKALRVYPPTVNVPVIALSALSVPEMRDDMHEMGCNAYVVKPIEISILLDTVKCLIKG